MVKVRFLGTCSGTEPISGMHHNSFVLEVNGVNYWFDAGENCAHYAFTSGVNVMNTKALFISHTHIDHTGGLANLLHGIRKLIVRENKSLINDKLKVFIPNKQILDCAIILVTNGKPNDFDIVEYNSVQDGVVFEDENIKVTAFHNKHLGEDGSNGWHSFSYLIEVEGKKIVFSGDVKNSLELDQLIGNGCDLLLHETGHHKVEKVLDYVVSKKVKKLRFIHHGREVINEPLKCEELCATYGEKYGVDIKIARDLMIEEI